jgi:hypothetical protein
MCLRRVDCPFTATSTDRMQRHVIQFHIDDPIACKQCNYLSVNSKEAKRHDATHDRTTRTSQVAAAPAHLDEVVKCIQAQVKSLTIPDISYANYIRDCLRDNNFHPDLVTILESMIKNITNLNK